MQVLPNLISPIADRVGRLLAPWNSYLQQFTTAPSPVIDLTVSASPFTYQAKEPGFVVVSGGTISLIHFVRGSSVITLTGQVLIPVGINDIVAVTYSVLPTIKFIPLYGATQR